MRKYQEVSHRSQGASNARCSQSPHGVLGGHNATVCSRLVSGRRVETKPAHRNVKLRNNTQMPTSPHSPEGIAEPHRFPAILKLLNLIHPKSRRLLH